MGSLCGLRLILPRADVLQDVISILYWNGLYRFANSSVLDLYPGRSQIVLFYRKECAIYNRGYYILVVYGGIQLLHLLKGKSILFMISTSAYDFDAQKEQMLPPVFIVGAPRSGTTLLAVLLDRHSNIAIGPETQFFTMFIPQIWANKRPETYEQLVDSALEFERIADFGLERDQLLQQFRNYELSFGNLLRAIIETHAIRQAKRHPGEKTPLHLEHVPMILNQFPNSKVICVIRDGRDVVRSLLDVPWATPGNPRRFRRFCMRWNDRVEAMINYEKTLPLDRYMTVKFEDILKGPKAELEKICAFIGEEFEPTQLEPAQTSSVIPDWEKKWKNKASEMLDPGRVEAWRRSADRDQIWAMNSMMGDMLERMGYADTKLEECPPAVRAKLFVQKIPYSKRARKLASLSLKILKKLRLAR